MSTSAERMRKTRERRRGGLRAVTIIVSDQDIDYLIAGHRCQQTFVHPALEKVTLVLEGIGGGKVRVSLGV